jgi:outer membrane protein
MKTPRILFAVAFIAALAAPAGAQQITRAAVINLSNIYMAFFRDSKAVRDLVEKRNKILADDAQMKAEIEALKQKKTEADASGDKARSLLLETQIAQKTQDEQEYYWTKYAEYIAQKNKITDQSVFSKDLLRQIETVAESNGYSIVFDVQQNEGIIWYSPSVDITDLVISTLQQSQAAGR